MVNKELTTQKQAPARRAEAREQENPMANTLLGQIVGASLLDPRPDSAPSKGAVRALVGVAQGTQVLTLDGALPVEFLAPGDRVITRAGARKLVSVSMTAAYGAAVRVAPGALGHDRPEQALIIGAGTQVLVRDWRAKALYGAREALVPVTRLVDGEFVTLAEPGLLRLYALEFDQAEVYYADGVEVSGAAAGALV